MSFKKFTESVKVGKKFSNSYYVQASAIDKGETNITPKLLEIYNKAASIINSIDFEYDFVNISNDKVRFMKMNSLEEAHPVVTSSKIVEVTTGKISDGKINNQIYHRLDLIVSPSDPTYNFHKAVANYEVNDKKLLGQKDTPLLKIGYLKFWKEHINNIFNYDQYEKDISNLKKDYLDI